MNFPGHCRRFAAGLSLALPCLAVDAMPHPIEVEMTAGRWTTTGHVEFLRRAGFPHGLMHVTGGGATLVGRRFANGTIDFDIMEDADNQGIPGVWFRERDADSAENVYLRLDADCPRSIECVQYAPVRHGNVQWDVFPEYESGAPVHASGWNHVRLVVSGARMDVFVNGQATPALRVGHLEGDAAGGSLQLRGDATFANLVLAEGAVHGLSPVPLPDPVANDPRYLRHWEIAPTGPWQGQEVDWSSCPAATAAWRPLDAGRKGFVDVGREHGTPRGTPDLAWIRTTVVSERATTRHVAFGWAREAWVFVNGQRVFADRNLYYPASGRKSPMGRLSIDNGGFDVPLRAGANDIAVALANDLHSPSGRHWGWGFEWRFDDVSGLILPPPG